MTKLEFLKAAAAAARSDAPAFAWTHEEGRNQYVAIGRDIGGHVFVYLRFSARPDNRVVGHGVGWAPSREVFLESRASKANEPIQNYDGSLRRLLRLEHPRDFTYAQVQRETPGLYLPFARTDLDAEAPEAIIERMRQEIREYALPYLCLMLRHRFGMELSVQALARGDGARAEAGSGPSPG
jgi:hypothetical protein